MNDTMLYPEKIDVPVTRDQFKQVAAEAERLERSKAYIMREALDAYLARIRRQTNANKKEQK